MHHTVPLRVLTVIHTLFISDATYTYCTYLHLYLCLCLCHAPTLYLHRHLVWCARLQRWLCQALEWAGAMDACCAACGNDSRAPVDWHAALTAGQRQCLVFARVFFHM